MSEEFQPNALIAVDHDVDQDRALLAEVASGKGFLPYIQLFTSKSEACTEGKIPIGHYGLVQDQQITDLGDEIYVIFLAVRARAFEKRADGTFVVCFDKNDPEYKRIQEFQANKVNGCMAGPEFLVWVPSEESFATIFCGSATLQKEARKWGTYLGGNAATLGTKLCQNPKGKWHGPTTRNCSSPLSPLPEQQAVIDKIHSFKNPPKQQPAGEKIQGNATGDVSR